MFSSRNRIIDLIEQGTIPQEKIEEALSVVKITPDGHAWRTFIDALLLWLGGLALAFSIVFFIAYNWSDFGRFAKFGLVEVFIVLAIAAYYKLDENTITSKVTLLVALIGIGALLALYGQTYQSGADTWQLFFTWSLLILPWVLIGRFSAIWLVWIMLVNISVILYFQVFRTFFLFDSHTTTLWAVFFCNTFFLVIWELSAQKWLWLQTQWAIRLLALGCGVPITMIVLNDLFSRYSDHPAAFWVWIVFFASIYLVYRKLKPDLFMLAGLCLSAMTVSIAFLGKHLLHHLEAGGFFLLTLLIIGMGIAATTWLKSVYKEFQS